MRARIALTMGVWMVSLACGQADAQDNPVLRRLAADVIKKHLSKHHTEDTAWHTRRREAKQRTEVFGQIAVRVRWTEEHQTWVWVEAPDRSLTVQVSRLESKDGRFHFVMKVTGDVRFRFRSRIEGLVSAELKGKARAEMAAEGSLVINGEGQIADTKVTKLDAKLNDLDVSSDRVVRDLLKDAANLYMRHEKDRFKKEVERALNGLEI